MAMRSGRNIPDRIANAPELRLGLQIYMSAWLDLNTTRSIGMSTGPIPWLAVHEWAMLHELDLEQKEQLHIYIPAMDAEYFNYLEYKRETDG